MQINWDKLTDEMGLDGEACFLFKEEEGLFPLLVWTNTFYEKEPNGVFVDFIELLRSSLGVFSLAP